MTTNELHHFFISCPPHTEDLLTEELGLLGFLSITTATKGVYAQGTVEHGYLACLWSRIANRVFFLLHTSVITDLDALYQQAADFPWEKHFTPERLFRVSCTMKGTDLTNPDHASLVVKDGIVDRFRSATGRRPSVDRKSPDIRIYVYIEKETVSFYLDFSGESIHKRGYRVKTVEAGLKENIAAALLYRCNWHKKTAAEQSDASVALIDPMCGSGTILIEAALMAANRAPGLLKSSFGFTRWLHHNREVWERVKREAEERARIPDRKGESPTVGGRKNRAQNADGPEVIIKGFDWDERAIKASAANAKRAGVAEYITFERKNLVDLREADFTEREDRLVLTNPPYGDRLGEEAELFSLYQAFGRSLKRYCHGAEAGVLTGNRKLARFIGLKAEKTHTIYNGPIRCGLYHFVIDEHNRFSPKIYPLSLARVKKKPKKQRKEDTGDTEALFNRFSKNKKRLKHLLKKENITCYRLYDAEIPEYSAAVDVYESQWVLIQEYEPPVAIDHEKRVARLNHIVRTAEDFLSVPSENIYLKIRKRMKGERQYQKQAKIGERFVVNEYGHRFYINLTDYIDTGLFLDSRGVRQYIEQNASGKRFLNLFCYTGTATVYAAAGGAVQTISVDHNNRYVSQAKENLALNGISGQQTGPQKSEHRFIVEDCFHYMERYSAEGVSRNFDLIFLGPPTFSNTKGKKGVFDLNKDHPRLLKGLVPLLAAGGEVVFLSNAKGFTLDWEEVGTAFKIEDISEETHAPDFLRKKEMHHCYSLTLL